MLNSCFNSCDQQATFTSKGISNHRHREIMASAYRHLRYGSHQNIPTPNKTIIKRKWWTPGPHQHPASTSWYELRTSTTSSTAIWIRIRHSTTGSFVKRSSITLSPLAILFCCSPDSGFAGLCHIAWMLHQRDQWHSLMFSYVVHSHIFS